MKLRLANVEPKRITLFDEEESWIEVNAEISKRTFNELIVSMPEGIGSGDDKKLNIGEAMEFQANLFKVFVTAWSLEVDATVDNYMNLERTAGSAIDEALAKHFESISPVDKELDKSA